MESRPGHVAVMVRLLMRVHFGEVPTIYGHVYLSLYYALLPARRFGEHARSQWSFKNPILVHCVQGFFGLLAILAG